MAEVKGNYMKYIFKWRQPDEKGWHHKEVVGHKYHEESGRMTLFIENGGIYEIPNWNQNYSDLGKDWAEKVTKQYEEELAKNTKDKEDTDVNK